jgi:signal transduction histidine kinase
MEGPTLVIADDGVGFDASRPVAAGHQGLANMDARAQAMGARLRVESAEGEGTRIIVVLPNSADA